jgi:poly(3-hydroxybutyrate) depolymerase
MPAMVPLAAGSFDLDDYIDYVIAMLHLPRPGHPCDGGVPALGAGARCDRVMEARGDRRAALDDADGRPDRHAPQPDRRQPLAMERGSTGSAQRHHAGAVPASGLLARGLSRLPAAVGLHGMNSTAISPRIATLFKHLIEGDGDSAEKHRDFYDEYLAVMDLTAEFYLQTVDTVFVKHALPKGEMMHRGEPVDLKAIRGVALMTVEGENDDISGVGQTKAAHDLCVNIPAEMRAHLSAEGRRPLRRLQRLALPLAEIAPRIADFMRKARCPIPGAWCWRRLSFSIMWRRMKWRISGT